MTFAKNFRGLAFGALALGLVATAADAQNGTNYHVLANDLDVAYIGVGAGGSQTTDDGIMTWVPPEELRGSHRDNIEGDYAYKQISWRESMCVFGFGGAATGNLQFPLIALIELDDASGIHTGYAPDVFVQFEDTTCAITGLGGSAGFIPFGAPTSSSASFVLAGLPSACGTGAVLLPNENIANSGGGFATILACATGTNLSITSTGFCWGVQFTWLPSAVPSIADINNGWVHYLRNGQDGNQYWGMSNDELNIWSSNTVNTDTGLTAVLGFLANSEYNLLMASVDGVSHVAQQPAGVNAGGSYYFQTEGFTDVFSNPAFNPNLGFDLGMGSRITSLDGFAGVTNLVSGFGNQDPLNVGGVNPNGGGFMLPSFGLWTFSNGGGLGRKMATWISINFDDLFLLTPDVSFDITVLGDTVRVPSAAYAANPAFPQPVTNNLQGLFSFEVDACPSGCPDPGGFASGAFGVPAIQGGSIQLPTLGVTPLCAPSALGFGLPLHIGSSQLKGAVGSSSPGGFDWAGDVTIRTTNLIFD